MPCRLIRHIYCTVKIETWLILKVRKVGFFLKSPGGEAFEWSQKGHPFGCQKDT